MNDPFMVVLGEGADRQNPVVVPGPALGILVVEGFDLRLEGGIVLCDETAEKPE
jgi:hypothetical protein